MSARALVAVTVLAALIVLASSFIRGSGLLAFFLSTEDVPFKQAECTRIDSNLQGYLHSSRPLTKDDTETCPKGNGPEIIELTGPGVWYHPRKYSGQVGYTLGRRVGPNWYLFITT